MCMFAVVVATAITADEGGAWDGWGAAFGAAVVAELALIITASVVARAVNEWFRL